MMNLFGRPTLLLSSMPMVLMSISLLLGPMAVVGNDTVLDDQFCQNYYTLSDGDCPSLRSSVRSEIRGNGTPTLELGDPETQPAMVLVHGWPDTSALWANQFDAFCGENNTYFCVSPSWIDFHPDYPRANESTLFWSNQREDFYAVIEDLGLSNITLVIFDFSALLGYQMLYLYPDLFDRVISMDIAMATGQPVPPFDGMINFLEEYQQNNINAFLTDDNDAMMANINTFPSPCADCRIAPNATGIGARTGWPYYQIIRTDQPWMGDGFDVPLEEWEFTLAPSFPENIPILYLWASEMFQDQTWFDWIDGRGDGSEHMQVEDADHWMQVRQPEIVNAKIAEWISASTENTSDVVDNNDTVLDDQFCQNYYTLSDGDCPSLRSSIRSEIRGNGTPTLELGDPETQPAMVLLHGWPDTSALWANQFDAFCGENNTYFCVSPSWIDFHPDYPRANESTLFWSNQREDFYAVIEDLGLSNITLVIFDFSALLGYQMLYLYPDLFDRVISMDIAMATGQPVPPFDGMINFLEEYQQNNINAFLTDDNDAMMANINTFPSPCADCRIAPNATGIGARTGWPYYQFVRTDQPWVEDGFDVPVEEWEFYFAPSFPEHVPILYLWASEMFQDQTWFDWIDGRGDGSEHMQVEDADHWIQVRQPEIVNAKIAEWISASTENTSDVVDKNDTVLDDQFCQNYYTLSDGDCPSLRSSVRSEIRGNGTPTLELGDPETQPAMVLLHGWPDTSALWANQFDAFCGENNTYFCVSPSWIDFHPDYPRANESTLFWSNQREDFHAVIEDLGLSNITLVIFDFSALLGYQMLYLYPDLFDRVISMDIAMATGQPVPPFDGMINFLEEYQQNNINAFLTDDNDAMMANINTFPSPCADCRIAPNATGIGARTGWPYYQIIRTDQPWMGDGFDVPLEEWEFTLAPSFPENIPILYLWASEMFQDQTWFDWIDGRGDGSEHMQVEDADHWMQVRQPEIVNAKIAEWISASTDNTSDADSTNNESGSELEDGESTEPQEESSTPSASTTDGGESNESEAQSSVSDDGMTTATSVPVTEPEDQSSTPGADATEGDESNEPEGQSSVPDDEITTETSVSVTLRSNTGIAVVIAATILTFAC